MSDFPVMDVLSFDEDGITFSIDIEESSLPLTIHYVLFRPLTRKERILYFIRHPIRWIRRGFQPDDE